MKGKGPLKECTVSKVDENRRPYGQRDGGGMRTVLLSVGLIPETNLPRRRHCTGSAHQRTEVLKTWKPPSGIFGCGNVACARPRGLCNGREQSAGEYAAKSLTKKRRFRKFLKVDGRESDKLPVPQKIRLEKWKSRWSCSSRVKMLTNYGHSGQKRQYVLHQFPRQHMAPGEMERIVIPRTSLEQAMPYGT
jgi:hypothetical protein